MSRPSQDSQPSVTAEPDSHSWNNAPTPVCTSQPPLQGRAGADGLPDRPARSHTRASQTPGATEPYEPPASRRLICALFPERTPGHPPPDALPQARGSSQSRRSCSQTCFAHNTCHHSHVVCYVSQGMLKQKENYFSKTTLNSWSPQTPVLKENRRKNKTKPLNQENNCKDSKGKHLEGSAPGCS